MERCELEWLSKVILKYGQRARALYTSLSSELIRAPPAEGLEPWNPGQLSKTKGNWQKGLSCEQLVGNTPSSWGNECLRPGGYLGGTALQKSLRNPKARHKTLQWTFWYLTCIKQERFFFLIIKISLKLCSVAPHTKDDVSDALGIYLICLRSQLQTSTILTIFEVERERPQSSTSRFSFILPAWIVPQSQP